VRDNILQWKQHIGWLRIFIDQCTTQQIMAGLKSEEDKFATVMTEAKGMHAIIISVLSIIFHHSVALFNDLNCMGSPEGATSCRVRRLFICYVVILI
jgi:hypothetical protein